MSEPNIEISDLRAVNARLFFDFPPVRTDIGLALASGALSAMAAIAAAERYHSGGFPRLIVSGGAEMAGTEDYHRLIGAASQAKVRPPRPGEIEAHYMRDILLDLDVPDGVIVIEDRSLNTEENIRYASRLGLGGVQSVTLIANAIHGRRALMTLRKQRPFPQPIVAIGSVYPLPGIDRTNWHTHRLSSRWTMSEYDKTFDYVSEGLCVEIDIAAERRMAGTLAPL